MFYYSCKKKRKIYLAEYVCLFMDQAKRLPRREGGRERDSNCPIFFAKKMRVKLLVWAHSPEAN